MKVMEKTLFAGFGGQGILAIGKIYADACYESDMSASWLPSYGPEMRGGTCMCMVAVSNEKVLSPYFVRPNSAIIMNQASMDKYLPVLTTAKFVVVNTSLITLTEEMREALKDVDLIELPSTDIAIELGNVKCANMVALGAFATRSNVIDFEGLKESVTKKFAKKPAMVALNMSALDRGYSCK